MPATPLSVTGDFCYNLHTIMFSAYDAFHAFGLTCVLSSFAATFYSCIFVVLIVIIIRSLSSNSAF